MQISDVVTLGNIVGWVGVGGTIFTVVMNGRKVRRENEADARDRAEEIKAEGRERSEEIKSLMAALRTDLGKRLTVVETEIKDFMPRREIEGKIEHEKGNRVASNDALARRTDGLTSDIRSLMIEMGAVKQRQDGGDAQLAEIKTILKEGLREQGAKVDKLAEAVAAIPHAPRR